MIEKPDSANRVDPLRNEETQETSPDKPCNASWPPDVEPDAWDELIRLGQAIGRGWKSPRTGPRLLSEMRR